MTQALEMFRSMPRYLAQRAGPSATTGRLAPLRLVEREVRPPTDGWVRIRPLLAGICGSDLGALSGKSSFYFSALVSMPFVPGHEVVGELLEDADGLAAGERVVLDPVLSCATRGIAPPCGPCAEGNSNLCERITAGHVKPGLQTGYCADTGGGWGGALVAHRSQLHAVPDEVSNADAVMVEPAACAVHAVRRARVPRDASVLVVGAGTVGLLTVMTLRRFSQAGRVLVAAKHARQLELARDFGASDVIPTPEALGALRRASAAFKLHPERSSPFLLGGVDVAFDCGGTTSSLELALRATRGQGRVVLAAMPAGADLSPAWFRELELVGAYSGAGSFPEATEFAAEMQLGRLVSATYPLDRWRDALDHAFSSGRLGTVKVAFDPTGER